MNRASLERVLTGYPGATMDQPFGPETLVYKVEGKMFALVAIDKAPLRLTLKCDPDKAVTLRAAHAAVGPGYYMNKRHWNTIVLDGSLPDDELTNWILHSFLLVVRGLPKRVQAKLEGLEDLLELG